MLRGGVWIFDGKKWELQGHVFDYNFVDETVTQEKTFVFVETDIDVIHNNIFTDFNLYVCIFTSKNLVRLNCMSVPTAKQVKDMGFFSTDRYGNRVDALCDCVDGILNGSSKIRSIGRVIPAPRNHMTIYSPNNKYYGKCLKYVITDYNSGGDDCRN